MIILDNLQIQFPVNYGVLGTETINKQELQYKYYDDDLIELNTETKQIRLISRSTKPKIAVYKGNNTCYLIKDKVILSFSTPVLNLAQNLVVYVTIDSNSSGHVKLDRITEYTIETIPSHTVFENIFHSLDFTHKHSIVNSESILSNSVYNTYSIDPNINFAQDVDDAIHFEYKEDYLVIGVHIADVSRYFNEEYITNYETIYFTQNVVYHMLPKEIMNQCSLNNNELRHAVTVLIHMNYDGDILSWSYEESVVRNTTMNYKAADELISNNPEWGKFYEIVQKHRTKRLDNYTDTQLKANQLFVRQNYYVSDESLIIESNETPSHILVEELMILANNLVGQELHRKGYEMFRYHPVPVLNSELSLSSIKAATYSHQDTHFALNKQYYTHFTSPIRRYLDILVHQALLDRPMKYTKQELPRILEKINKNVLTIEVCARHEYEFKLYRYLKLTNNNDTYDYKVFKENDKIRNIFIPGLNIRTIIPKHFDSDLIKVKQIILEELVIKFLNYKH